MVVRIESPGLSEMTNYIPDFKDKFTVHHKGKGRAFEDMVFHKAKRSGYRIICWDIAERPVESNEWEFPMHDFRFEPLAWP